MMFFPNIHVSIPSTLTLCLPCLLYFLSHPMPLHSLPLSFNHNRCIVESLQKLSSMFGRKNISKKSDYDQLKTVQSKFFPPLYNNHVIFFFPLISSFAPESKAKSMQGMDKHYNGHT